MNELGGSVIVKETVKNVICAGLFGITVYCIVGMHNDIKAIKEAQQATEKHEILKVEEYIPQESKYDRERQELILENQELQGITQDGVISEEPASIILYDIPLDAETQQEISQICDEWEISDTLVYGIYAVETGNTFNPEIKNADGSCIGLGQINRRCHSARMEKLEVDDLTDPIQNTIVTVDILSELFEKYGDDVPYVLMCYNAGEGNARKMARRGITETPYTRKVMREQERIENGTEQ